MQHSFDIDEKASLLKEKFTGPIKLNLLTEINEAILEHPKFRRGLKFLTDLREAHISVDYDEMSRHVSSMPSLENSKNAFVVDNDLQYGMVRMFMALTAESGQIGEAQVFRSVEEGIQWLT